MEKKDFAKLENMCQLRFMEAGCCFHVCSQENHPVLFHDENEFKAVMNIVAFSAFLFQDVRIFTFEIMANHFHFALSGEETRIGLFLKTLVSKLSTHPVLSASSPEAKNLSFKTFPIDSLNNLRNVIAYINRNGAVVNSNENVFTYRWGGNRFFFNDEAKLRHSSCGKITTIREKRELFHSNLLAEDRIITLDGYVSPMSYCKIAEAESFFRNSRHYFYSISRNIESSLEIARIIGESIFYSDEDLFVYIKSLCVKRYGCNTIAELPKDAKIALAKDLRFNYNAASKQICRILKMELPIVSALFPER